MPGICGIIGKQKEPQLRMIVESMLKPVHREPFYTFGNLVSDSLGVGLSWSCPADSFCDCLPIWNEKKNIGLIFYGECFGQEQQINDLKQKGHNVEQENARYLVHLYEEDGIAFLKKLNGWFAGLLIDLREKKVFLFNDRYGLGRIYVHEADDLFLFSSEAKSLLKVVPELRRTDLRSLGEWFACGAALQNRTLFSGISLLPSGSVWTFADGTLSKEKYFNPADWESQPSLSQEEYYKRLIEVFPRAVRKYLAGKQTVGMSLTGGLDGRLIMAWSSPTSGTLPCYTFNGPLRDCADVKIARRIAKACGQSYRTLQISGEFLTDFPKLAGQTISITDGAMDVSGAAELYLNRLAREISPVRLTGNYGSEILRENIAFRPRALCPNVFHPDFENYIQAAGQTYNEELNCSRQSFIAFKQVPWHHFARFALEQSQLDVRSPFLDNELVALSFQKPPSRQNDLVTMFRLIEEGKEELSRIPTDRGITFPANNPMNQVRRAVAEFLAKAEYAYDYGMPQWLVLVDHVLSSLRLERLFLGRQKFCHFRIWYRDALASYVKEILLDSRTLSRAHFNARGVEEMVMGHLNGRCNFTMEIHKLLSVELFYRQLID